MLLSRLRPVITRSVCSANTVQASVTCPVQTADWERRRRRQRRAVPPHFSSEQCVHLQLVTRHPLHVASGDIKHTKKNWNSHHVTRTWNSNARKTSELSRTENNPKGMFRDFKSLWKGGGTHENLWITTALPVEGGPGNSVGIAAELRAGRSGIESRWGRDFQSVQTDPGAHPASCTMGTGSFPGVKCGRACCWPFTPF